MKSITKYATYGQNIKLSNLTDPSVAWGGLSQLANTDGVYASNDFGDGVPANYYPLTKWLNGYNFRFFSPGDANVLSDFPSNGTTPGSIVGISVSVVRHCRNTSTHIVGDYEVGLVTRQTGGQQLYGSSSPTLYMYPKIGDQLPWPVDIDQTITYGSDSDLWGRNWTPAELNDINFGFVLCAAYQASPLVGPDYGTSSSQSIAFVDSIAITVYYNAAANVTATSGGSIGGTAIVSKQTAANVTGGTVVNGSYFNNFVMPSSSGAIIGSSATVLPLRIPAINGGCVIGGQASVQYTSIINATGGGVLNGDHYTIFVISSSGGVISGGTSTLTANYSQIFNGGGVANGSAIAGITPYTYGGAICGGTTTPTLIIRGQGGAVVNGTSDNSATYNVGSIGGCVNGSTITVNTIYGVTTSGGVVTGGKFTVGISSRSTGGSILGGKFTVGISSPSTGGTILGGSATISLRIFGQGGATISGLSQVRGTYSIQARAGAQIGGKQTVPEYIRFFQTYQNGYCRVMSDTNICTQEVVPELMRFIKDPSPQLDPNRFTLNNTSTWCNKSPKECGKTPLLPNIIVKRQKGHVPPNVA